LSLGYNPAHQTTSFTPSGQSTEPATYTDADQQNRTQLGNSVEQNGLFGHYSSTTNGVSAYFTHLPTGTHQALGETIDNNTYYYLTDLLGSVVTMTDGIGNVKNTYSYSPYGTLLSQTGNTQNPYMFAGGYYDHSTKLYKFGERYYNPKDARWLQLDPSGQDPGYIYTGDDPVNFTDPNGTDALTCAFDIGLGLEGGSLSVFGGALSSLSAGTLTPLGALNISVGVATFASGFYGIVHNGDCNGLAG
jgi:RHS repeat-associated protein